jgi:hypothetical protein
MAFMFGTATTCSVLFLNEVNTGFISSDESGTRSNVARYLGLIGRIKFTANIITVRHKVSSVNPRAE